MTENIVIIYLTYPEQDYQQKPNQFMSNVITVSCCTFHMQQNSTLDLIGLDGFNWIKSNEMLCAGLCSVQLTVEGEGKAASAVLTHSD